VTVVGRAMLWPMRSSVCVLALALSTACRSTPTAAPAGEAVTAPTAASTAKHDAPPPPATLKRFGEPIAPGDTVALSSVLAAPDDFASHTVTVEAKVRRNCTRRGCWMELSQALDPSLPGCRVTFKDYGFFVPLDSAGSTAKVQGTVEVTRVAPDEVAHLESEGARFATKQPDGTAREVRLVATGVELWREQT
jgi:hypothetical protein